MEKKMIIRSTTIKDQVYEILKEKIQNAEFPPNAKLNEQELADSMGVSRSPVREAIKQLVGDGLVINIPNRGTFVRALTEKELVNTYDVRLMFESYAAQRAPDHLTPADITELKKLSKAMKQAHEKGNQKLYFNLDIKLHTMLIRLSDNEIVLSTYQTLCTLLDNFRALSLVSEKRFTDSLDEHIGMIDCLLSKDKEQLAAIVDRHLSLARDSVHDRITTIS